MRTHRTLLLCLSLSLLGGRALAQGEADKWYFGNRAALDFSGGLGPVPLTNSQMATDEGCASISDNAGNLLFYTDGIRIWNSVHTVVNPSALLLGHASSTQSSIILPRPGTTDRYFIFTQGKQYGGCSNGTHWTEVQVVGTSITILSLNNNLVTCAMGPTEKLTAICGGSQGPDYWAITMLRNGQFRAYPVTAAGVGPVVISPVTASPGTGGDDDVGYMKVSSQGNLLALARRASTSVSELFRFDNNTGQVTANLGAYHNGVTYGIEFSPSGNYLYASHWFSEVRQYSTTSLAGTLVHSSPGGVRVGALQLGPDGNIYVANGYENQNASTVDQIANADLVTPAYNDNFVTLPSGHFSRLGLPDLVNCFMMQDCEVGADFKWNFDQHDCGVRFQDLSAAGGGTDIVAWHWTFGDGTSSDEQHPTHYFPGPGGYVVCLTVTGFDGRECCVSTVCFDIWVERDCGECKIEPDMIISAFEPDCHGDCRYSFEGTTLFANRPVVAWLWDLGDGTTATGRTIEHQYASSGSYTVCLTVIGASHGERAECCTFEICRPIQVDCGPIGMAPGAGDNEGTAKDGAREEMATEADPVRVYPNPAQDKLSVELMLPAEQTVRLMLMGQDGTPMQVAQLRSGIGLMTHVMDIEGLSSGIYLLRIVGKDIHEVRKVQVIR